MNHRNFSEIPPEECARPWTHLDTEVVRCHPWADTEGVARAIGVSPAYVQAHKRDLEPNSISKEYCYEHYMADPLFRHSVEHSKEAARRLLLKVQTNISERRSEDA